MDKRKRRHFRRYKKISQFDLLLENKTYKAEMVNYSVDGIVIIIEDSPPVSEGAILDLTVSEPSIQTKGEVVWIERSGSHIRLGIKKIGHLNGFLKDYNLADILTGLQRRKITGILEIRNDPLFKKIYLREGHVIFSESNQSDVNLGDILLREGKIKPEQYDHFLDVLKRTGKKQGAVLVELGYLNPRDLILLVKNQVEEIIMSLFDIENGRFKFRECPMPDGVVTLKLSGIDLIYRGMKRMSNRYNLEAYKDFYQLSDDSIFRFSSDHLGFFQSLRLDDAGKEILSYIDEKTTIRDILLLSRYSEFETLKTLYALLSTGIIEVKVVSSGDTKYAAEGTPVENVKKATDRMIPREIIDKIEYHYIKFKKAGYYDILGLGESATFEEIKRAYHKGVKEFHPDRYSCLFSEDVRTKLNAIFSFITEAYAILSDPEKKRWYDSQLSHKKHQKTSNAEIAKVRFEEAMSEFRNKDFARALEFFGQASYLDSSIAKYHYYYGLSLSKLKRYKEAERAIQKALRIDSSNADYLAELGYVYLSMGFLRRAKRSFEKALKLSPSHRRANEGMLNV